MNIGKTLSAQLNGFSALEHFDSKIAISPIRLFQNSISQTTFGDFATQSALLFRPDAARLGPEIGVELPKEDHAERALGHTIKGVEGVYDRHDYVPEKADAVNKLAASLIRSCTRPRARWSG